MEHNRYGSFLLYTGPITEMCAGIKGIALVTLDAITSLSKRVTMSSLMFYPQALGN
jgi:hypothetical protein